MEGLCSCPCKEDQQEVLQQGSTDATEGWNGCSVGSKDEDEVEAHQSKGEVDENLFVFLFSQGPKTSRVQKEL